MWRKGKCIVGRREGGTLADLATMQAYTKMKFGKKGREKVKKIPS